MKCYVIAWIARGKGSYGNVRKSHLARKCNSRRQPNRTKRVGTRNSANFLDDQSEVDNEGVYSMDMYTMTDNKVKPNEVNFSINGQDVCMEIDTGPQSQW